MKGECKERKDWIYQSLILKIYLRLTCKKYIYSWAYGKAKFSSKERCSQTKPSFRMSKNYYTVEVGSFPSGSWQ
jgi:hypothetical protein